MRHGLALALTLAIILTGCLTDKKTLVSGLNNANTPADSQETFNLSFAYRETSANAANRIIQFQGNHLLNNASLSSVCGNTGSNCTCDFYTSASDTSPVTATVVSLSTTSNVFSCTVPGAVAIGSYTYARLRTVDYLSNSGLINISTTLTPEQVLGDLDKTFIRKIYDYSCTRVFLEGEGVGANSITCSVDTFLGFLYADYNFYLYQGVTASDTNFTDLDTAPKFYTEYCARTNDLQLQCSAQNAVPAFGLINKAYGFFQTSVYLNSKPSTGGASTKTLFGYAAIADSDGNCPPGLAAKRTWRADPPSITKNSLGSNPPSSFININGNLNNAVLADANSAPASFVITRTPGATACIANDCSGATFAGTAAAASVAYSSQSPIICVLSTDVLSRL